MNLTKSFWTDHPNSGWRNGLLLFAVMAVLLPWGDALAAADAPQAMKWGTMFMALFGGLALFLYGMDLMSEALKVVAGDKMKMILAKLTTSPIAGLFTGAFVTSIIQSSSVTTVLVVSFITAGVMTFQQSLGVIFGANIGTTITAQIVAFKITEAASLMVAIGYLGSMLTKKENVRQYNLMLMGLGLIFLGMNIMGDSMSPLRKYDPFLDLMRSMDNPVIGILISLAFTGIIQSSSATTGIVIVMASQGFISLQAGIALAFGANIGTCVTALIASLGKPREAVRAGMAHIGFNILGVILFYPFIGLLADVVTRLSPVYSDLEGMARMAAETPRQIANAHTIFNLTVAFIFLPLLNHYARLLLWILPPGKAVDKKEGEIQVMAFHLNEDLISTPVLALDAARREIKNMGLRVHLILDSSMPIIMHGDNKKLRWLADQDNEIDHQYGNLIHYLGRVNQASLSDEQTQELMTLVNVVTSLEDIGDIIETNLVHLGELRLEKGIEVSEETENSISEYHKMVVKAVDMAVRTATEEGDTRAWIAGVRNMQAEIDQMMLDASVYHMQRLTVDAPNRVEAFKVEMDIRDMIRRIYYLARAIVRHSSGETSFTQQLVFRRNA
ncbi:MAG: Na/Pi cotransporter family protein [Magnetococcales bacterium]|nr:Na/Pi cotransporter family protein [Magnetococcales bacterium]